MPGVACDWLSETAIVLNSSATPPAAVTPSLTPGGELALVQVARHRPGPGRGDADDRAVEPGWIDAHGAEVRACAGPLGAGGEALPCTPPQRVVAHGRLNASCRG